MELERALQGSRLFHVPSSLLPASSPKLGAQLLHSLLGLCIKDDDDAQRTPRKLMRLESKALRHRIIDTGPLFPTFLMLGL